ncbi:ribosomal RNA processing protein 1 homolog B isoform X2 [Dasypus novemcinctus]|uniref:ribosomal RNA processing protein 1 homolog B isoform X2 n=1 Tax=Dasypus novemcinctus TaxID=9361 RepID=UPI00265EB5A3|nr:ribosomal RNA processing protein 1 homolog B isoform X2 [Dasypus novemcinctus]
MAPAMQPAEIQFAQRLASNEKGIRERAVKKLRQYISVKTQRETGGFSQEELLKIWKGLFYCMWMQDEPLLQEELASTISQLIHVVSSSEAQHLFIQTFWQTVNREWKEIDRLRLDQYYMLIRLFLRQSFEVLKRNGWEESRIKLFLDVLMKEILHPESQSPDGVRFHFIDIYLDELSKVGGKELLADQNLKFIDPFCKIAARTKDHTLVQTIARGVFEVIVHQSPFAPEEIVREHKTRVGDGGLPEVETSENEMTWRKTLSKKRALGKHHSRKDGIGNDSDRAGCDTFEDTGPLLQFDYKAVADRLLEITSRKNTPPFNRKRLSKLIRKFQDLSEGSTARLSFAEDISAKREDQAVSQGRQKREGDAPLEETGWQKEEGNKFSLSAEERKDNVPRRKRKKKKSSLQPEVPGSGDEASCGNQNGSPEPEARKRQGPKAPAAEVGAGALPSTLGHPPARPSHKRKRLRKKSLRVQEGTGGVSASSAEGALQRGLSGEPSQEPASAATPTGGSQSLTGKRRLGVLPGRGGPALPAPPPPARLGEEGPPAGAGEGGAQRTPRPPSLKLKKRKAQPSSLDLCDLTNQKTALLKKRKKMKEILHLVEHNGALKMEAKQMQALGNSGTFIPLKKKKLRAESDFVKFEPSLLPKPLFFRKAKRSAAISSLGATVQFNKTPSSSKKVTFGLNRNTTAEFRKTDKSLLVSPTGPSRVAFNPEQRPPHGVLKSPSRSPAGAPLAAQRPLAAPLKRRPTAVDFF